MFIIFRDIFFHLSKIYCKNFFLFLLGLVGGEIKAVSKSTVEAVPNNNVDFAGAMGTCIG
jgi:hypothetical protein